MKNKTNEHDVRDLGGHFDTTFRVRAGALVGQKVRWCKVAVVGAVSLGESSSLWTKWGPSASQGIEVSPHFLLWLGFSKVCTCLCCTGAVLCLSDGQKGCDLGFQIVWVRFRIVRRCMAF